MPQVFLFLLCLVLVVLFPLNIVVQTIEERVLFVGVEGNLIVVKLFSDFLNSILCCIRAYLLHIRKMAELRTNGGNQLSELFPVLLTLRVAEKRPVPKIFVSMIFFAVFIRVLSTNFLMPPFLACLLFRPVHPVFQCFLE